MSFFTRSDGPAQLVGSHERCHQQPTSAQPEPDRLMGMLTDDQSDPYHQKQKRQKKNSRCFRVARFAEPPNFAQQQTQIVRSTFQCVDFAHIRLSPQPTPPSATGLTHMREASLASFAAPPIQAPSLLSTHSSSVGPKGDLISGRFVGPAPNLLPPLGDIRPHLPFRTPASKRLS